jgi:NADH dehydrogenase/NADH:ubiquinone oxidoreductase subunit G
VSGLARGASGLATIDGHEVEVRAGETILRAARRAGFNVPTLCYLEGCEPEGGCRLCLVGTDGGALRAACHTPFEPGMSVETTTPGLEVLRRGILQLIADSHLATELPHASELATLLERYGVVPRPAPYATAGARADTSHPYLRFDERLCIACRRCVHACEEIQGQFVYSMIGRGGAARPAAPAWTLARPAP